MLACPAENTSMTEGSMTAATSAGDSGSTSAGDTETTSAIDTETTSAGDTETTGTPLCEPELGACFIEYESGCKVPAHACQWAALCPDVTLDEGEVPGMEPHFLHDLDAAVCFLTALRDRQTGYLHFTVKGDIYDTGYSRSTYIFSFGDGTATSSGSDLPCGWIGCQQTYFAHGVFQLKDPALFDTCLAKLTVESPPSCLRTWRVGSSCAEFPGCP